MIKKVLKFLTHRIFIVGVLLLIQLLVLILILNKFEEYGWYFYIFFYVIGILVLLKIINGNANPSYKIAWIIPVLTIPIFGTLIYIIFGNKINKKGKLLEHKNRLKQILTQDDNVIKEIKMANYLDTKILKLELAEKNKPKEDKKEQTNTTNLVEEIKEDMTRWFNFIED